MNSVISSHTQLQQQLPSFHFLSKSNNKDISIASDKLKQSGVNYSSKKQDMFNKVGGLAGMGDKANSRTGTGFPGNIATQAALQGRAQTQSLLKQMTTNNMEESAQIKRRLAEIETMQTIQKLQQQQRRVGNIGFQGNANLLKHIPSNTNSSVLAPKQREDVMTKPDLSTLADAAVAVTSATNAMSARNSTGMLGRTIKPNDPNAQLAALLGRRNSLPVAKQPALPSSVAEMLRNDLNQNVNQNYKRTLEEMMKSDSAAPLPSESLFPSTTSLTSLQQLRMREQLQQRRNSLPARPSDLAPLIKKQRMIAQQASDIERLVGAERRLSVLPSQERRASIASSITSVGTSATAPNLTSTSGLPSPSSGRMMIDMLGSNPQQRSIVLEKLNKLSGGFPMPSPSLATSNGAGVPAPAPAQITPEAGKDIIDIITGGSRGAISLREKFNERQAKLGGFPFPLPLHTNSSENQRVFPQPDTRSNLISSHIRKNTGSYRVRKAPSLDSFKKAYNEIGVVSGGDHEKIRMEIFKRKLQRGDILVGRMMGSGNSTRFANSFVQQQRRLSGLSAHGSGTTVTSTSGRTQTESTER